MLKSELLSNLNKKHPTLSTNDIEIITNLFFKKIIKGLTENKNIEIRGFGSFKSKVNKSKVVRNPKTNQKIFKEKSYKIHFKVGKILHNRINIISDSNE
jgi:Bacterial nucleoid DNA-binding protein